jgi:hypothetical protein
MTVGGSLLLIAVGAILKFATNFRLAHVDIDTVGVILMIVGGVGFLIGLYQEVVRPRTRRDVVYDEREPPPRY